MDRIGDLDALGFGGGEHRPSDKVLAELLGLRAKAEAFGFPEAVERDRSHQARLPVGDRSGLIEANDVDFCQSLDRRTHLDQAARKAALPIEATKAVGVASTITHGQKMISIVIERRTSCVMTHTPRPRSSAIGV